MYLKKLNLSLLGICHIHFLFIRIIFERLNIFTGVIRGFDCVTVFITNQVQVRFHYRTLPIQPFSMKTANKMLQKRFREKVFE